MGLVFTSKPLYAWWDEGHRLISNTAYDGLSKEARASVDEIVNAFSLHHPDFKSFADLSTWPDYLEKEEKSLLYKDLHFITIPYDPHSILTQEEKENIQQGGVVASIHKARAVLQNPKSSMPSKCWALAYLSHVVADLHQPMHCCTRFSKELPQGDIGGNLHLVTPTKKLKAKNLHQLWDSAGGLFLQSSKKKKSSSVIIDKLPDLDEKGLSLLDPNVWIHESYQIATSLAYTHEAGSVADDSYLNKVQKVSKQRISLASYRLASILNETFASTNRADGKN